MVDAREGGCVSEQDDQRSVQILDAPAHHVGNIVRRGGVILQGALLLDEAGEDEQCVVVECITETDVVFEEAQDGGVEQGLGFALFQPFEFVEGILALQEFRLADRPQLARIFICQQHDGSSQVDQQIGRKQNCLLTCGIAQDNNVAVRIEMPDSGHHFSIGKFPNLGCLGGLRSFQQFPQLTRADQHPLPIRLLLERKHIIFDALEGNSGNGGGHFVPGDLRFEELEQFIQPLTFHCGSGEVSTFDAVALAELIQLILRKGGSTAIHARADQHRGRKLSLALELFQPELRAFERLLPVGGVENHQRGGDVFQKDGVDLAIHVLTCQIPQYGFAVGAILALETQLRKRPKLLTMRGGMLLELAVRQSPAQTRFTHARISDEDEFSGGVVDVLFCLAKKEDFVVFPDADYGIIFSKGGEDGEVRVEGYTGPIRNKPLCVF